MARDQIELGRFVSSDADGGHERGRLMLPADVVTQTVGILARKDGGKTYAACKLAESMLDLGAQVVAIDVVGKWWSLRVGADGRSRGKDIFVLGGKHGDVPLSPEAGKLVAKAVVEQRLSVVLDLTFMRKGQRRRFLADFGEEFLHLKQAQEPTTPVHVFVEEAQTIIPQMTRQGGPDENRMLGAFEDIVRLGRNAGIGVTMISQRPQSVNKEALSQVELLVCLGVNEVPARKTIEAWVQEKGAEREIIGELPGLAQGEAIVWSPSWIRVFGRVKIGQRTTFDASSTPKLGRTKAVGRLPKADVAALRASMEAAVKAAEAEDPRALKSRVVELERELAKKVPVVVREVPKEPRQERVKSILTDDHVKRIERATAKLLKVQDHLAQAQQVVACEVDNLNTTIVKAMKSTLPPTPPTPVRPVGLPATPNRPHPSPLYDGLNKLAGSSGKHNSFRAPTSGPGVPRLKAGAIVMVRVLAGSPSGEMKRSALTVHSIAADRTFADYLSTLRTSGYVTDATRGHVCLTAEGVELARGLGSPMRQPAAEVARLWQAKLKAGAVKMLDVLMTDYPSPVARDQCAERAGNIAPRTFADYLSTLRTAGLVEDAERGYIVASADLYVHGK